MQKQFISTQEVFDKTLPKKFNQIAPETAVDINLLCKSHMRYYDQKLIRSPLSGEWLRGYGCPSCEASQRAAEATRYVERLNGNKNLFDILNPANAEYRDECNAKVKKGKIL